jgi:hypothetical protein
MKRTMKRIFRARRFGMALDVYQCVGGFYFSIGGARSRTRGIGFTLSAKRANDLINAIHATQAPE